MINNYIKTPKQIYRKNVVEPEQFFFFNDLDPDSRREAWIKATSICSDPSRLAVFNAPGSGRYPGEMSGKPHPIVTSRLSPISQRTAVIGYAFEKPILPETTP